MKREEIASWLRLAMTPGVGNESARRLLAAFGLPQSIFEASHAALAQIVSSTQATALHHEPPKLATQVEATLDWLSGTDNGPARRIVTLGDADYPASLLDIEDPPLMLYLLGQAGPWPTRALAMVGSRNPTPQGRLNAEQFARAFSSAGLTVVSGLALGVDGAAHEGALEGGQLCAEPLEMATIAVIGTGIDRVYPRQHRDLAHRIARHGLIVSEYPLGTPPLAANFPKRNRLVSGLTKGTLVVEAALQSGSLITARLASEQGKEVFAIPGSIHGPQARGCHALIKQGAKLVESAQDVLEELHWPTASTPSSDSMAALAPEPDETGLLQTLGADPASLDALQARTGMPTAALQAKLLELELDGHVARLPGGLFQRLGHG